MSQPDSDKDDEAWWRKNNELPSLHMYSTPGCNKHVMLTSDKCFIASLHWTFLLKSLRLESSKHFALEALIKISRLVLRQTSWVCWFVYSIGTMYTVSTVHSVPVHVVGGYTCVLWKWGGGLCTQHHQQKWFTAIPRRTTRGNHSNNPTHKPGVRIYRLQ